MVGRHRVDRRLSGIRNFRAKTVPTKTVPCKDRSASLELNVKTKPSKGRKTGRRRRRTAVVLASALAATPAAAAPAMPQFTDEAIAKLSTGALRRLLLNLRQDEQAGGGSAALRLAADHDSHVMFGSHSSHGSHGQHTNFSNSA